MYFANPKDSLKVLEPVIHVTKELLGYQRIDFMKVWRSTIITTLTQDASDLLTIASVYNKAMDSSDTKLDKQKGELLEWVLIFHIIISWIFSVYLSPYFTTNLDMNHSIISQVFSYLT